MTSEEMAALMACRVNGAVCPILDDNDKIDDLNMAMSLGMIYRSAAAKCLTAVLGKESKDRLGFAFGLLVPALLLASCAPVYKARFDMTASGGIVWPGKPEKPRIKYLWSLHNLSGGEQEKDGVMDVVAGRSKDDAAGLQTSETLLRPQAVYADENRIYIADPGAGKVSILQRSTMDVLQITEGRHGESLSYPRSVVADGSGTIYISDSEMKKVMAYRPDGKFLFDFGGEFLRPEGLAIDRGRNVLYIADTDAHLVYVYGTDGIKKGVIGRKGAGPGEFYYPTYTAVDKDGNVYVTDFLNFRVQKFSPEGRFLKAIGSLGDSYDTLDKPKGVAVDTEGHIYIVDGAKDMVKIFDQDGRLLLFFGEKGERYGDFYLPAGIFIDEKNIVYVADMLNMRIQAFQFLGGD